MKSASNVTPGRAHAPNVKTKSRASRYVPIFSSGLVWVIAGDAGVRSVAHSASSVNGNRLIALMGVLAGSVS
eukprot:3184014-Pleurochrysis_carterae.AAC.1